MSEPVQRPKEPGKNEAPKLVPFGKYLLVERVAVGGMAEVWLSKVVASDRVSDLLAIKRILPSLSEDAEFVRMFVDEARIAGALDHPGIVAMHELGRIQSSFYIAMDYVWGRDLLAILRRAKDVGRVIPPVVSAYIGARMCDALHYAHTKLDKNGQPLGLVHRDISPQNVLLSFDGRVKLIDFGIAKATSRSSKTQAGTLKGKVGYMSPEQVRGLPIDARSDQFALGTCLYELLSGRPLFMRGNNLEAMNRVRDADVPPLLEKAPFCPAALAEIVMRALSKDREARFASTDEMRTALLVVLADMRISFERTELAEWLRDLFKEEFVRERARLDAMDLIGRPAVTVAKKHRNSATDLQIGSVDLFEDESDEPTEVWESPALPKMEPKEGPYEVFFHREGLVGLGAPPTEVLADGRPPLRATFRPGKGEAAEAYRPPRTDLASAAPPRPQSVPPPSRAPGSPPLRSEPALLEPRAELDPDQTLTDGDLGAEMIEQLRSHGIAVAIETSLAPPSSPGTAVPAGAAAAGAPTGSPSVIVSSTGNLSLKPEDIDSQIIRRIVPAEGPKKVRGEPTESIRADRTGRGRGSVGTRRRAQAELGFFGLAALLMLAVGVIGTWLVLTTRTAARVEVHSVPEVSAQVLVDGQLAGRTPLAIEELAPGRHVLTLIAPGFAVTTRDVAVLRAADMSLEIALEHEAESP
jgi:eukaryotic-like serine/threonine-protein kinase